MKHPIMKTSLRVAAALLVATASQASAERSAPGSLLVIPEYDNLTGVATLITVTNTNATTPVRVRFVYVSELVCQGAEVFEDLAPNDQITVLAGFHSPSQDRGYVYVHAVEGSTPIAFDWLVGEQTTVEGVSSLSYTLEPFAFRAGAQLAEGEATDLDGNGQRDLDGLEYEQAPNRILFPRFLGQTPGVVDSDLILINLTGASEFDATLDFLVYNDNSEVFSAAHTFRCWERVPLSTVSGFFDNAFLAGFTSQDPNEIVGATGQEAGWMRLDGQLAQSTTDLVLDPAFLAVLVDRHAGGGSAAMLPFERGSQPNGSLANTTSSEPPAPGLPICTGGTVACPCSNSGSSLGDEGCGNSTGVGARLDATGTSSFAADDLQLVVSQAPAKASGFFIQGGSVVQTPLGDGVLCAGPPCQRLQFRQTSATGEASTSVSLAGFVNPGDTVDYQFWFREPGSGGPCGGSSNLSNAYRVTWN